MDGGAWWAAVHRVPRVGHDRVTSLLLSLSLCSTGNYSQHALKNSGKESIMEKSMKMNTYIHMTESLGCTAEINTTL